MVTYCMVQSPCCEANCFATSQEFPRISRNPKVHYRNHKRPPPVSILGHPNQVHIPTSHLLEIRPNIILPSTSRSPSGLFPSGFPGCNVLIKPSLHNNIISCRLLLQLLELNNIFRPYSAIIKLPKQWC